MRRFLTFLLFALFTMAAGEFQGNAILKGRFDWFLMAVVLYALIAAAYYLLGRTLDRFAHGEIIYYFACGASGLLVIEWLILGNTPWQNPGAIQAGMFAWWAAIGMVPRIFSRDEGRPARRRVAVALIAYSAVSTLIVIALLGKAAPVVLGGVTGLLLALGFIIMNFMFLPYLERDGRRMWLRWFLIALAVLGVLNLGAW